MSQEAWRVIVWCAVSSRPQAGEDKASLPAQEEEGRAFAATVGGRVVDVLTVPGHSRDVVLYEDAAREMEAYAQLQTHCRAGDFDVLWARDPDRLGRDPALAQTVASLVEQAGAEVYVASAPHQLGQGSVGQRYVYAIQSVRAGEEQRRRVAHLRMGMRRRVQRGLLPNVLPIGYRAVRDPLTGATVGAEFDAAIGAVRMATGLYLQGASLHEIARALTRSPYRPPRSGRAQWGASTVRRMMANDAYAGRVSWGEHRNEDPSRRYPALWDEETYAAVQRERADRQGKPYRRRRGSPFLDVAFCARCGGRMVQHRNTGSPWLHLRCGTYARSAVTGERCHRNSVRVADVAEAVAAFLDGIRGVEVLEALAGQEGDEQDGERLAAIEREREAIEGQRRRVAMAYAGGAMDVQIYRETDEALVAQVAGLAEEARQLEARAAQTLTLAQRYELVVALRQRLLTMVADEPTQAAAMLRRLGVRVAVEDGQVVAVGLG